MAVAVVTIAELEEMLARSLTATETTRANYYIRVVSAFIASKCDQISFAEVEDDTKRAQADYYGIVELGGGPISSITSVVDVDGTEVTGFTFDGTGRISGLGPFQSVIITYTHGADEIPEDIKGVAAEVVLSCLTVQVSGPLKTRTAGGVTDVFQEGPNIVAELSSDVLDRYVTTSWSWRLGTDSGAAPSRPINWFQVEG